MRAVDGQLRMAKGGSAVDGQERPGAGGRPRTARRGGRCSQAARLRIGAGPYIRPAWAKGNTNVYGLSSP